MSSVAPQAASVTCPACGHRYSAPVQNVVDVSQAPRLKSMLLQGRLNVGVCPQCGTAGMLSVPLVYHDPAKEILFCLLPQEMRINETERQRLIGEMSNAIIRNLPSEQRKGYLLSPRIFLSLQSMAEAILEKDGITKEMLEHQRTQVRALEAMIQNVDDSLQLAGLIGQHQDKIDHTFFDLLAANIQLAEQAQQDDTVEKLTRLRNVLLEKTQVGEQIARQEQALNKAVGGIDEDLTREELLDRVLGIEEDPDDEILTVLVAVARPLVDYQFFQMLTARIQAAENEEDSQAAEKLASIRTKILQVAQELDAAAREQMQQRADLLSEIVQSSDRKAVIAAHIDEIDSAFMSVLEANIAQNQQLERTEVVEALVAVRDAITQVLREAAPPEIQFIERLLEAEYPDETRKILSESSSMLTTELVSLMDLLSKSMAERGDQETSEKLSGIQSQAQLVLG